MTLRWLIVSLSEPSSPYLSQFLFTTAQISLPRVIVCLSGPLSLHLGQICLRWLIFSLSGPSSPYLSQFLFTTAQISLPRLIICLSEPLSLYLGRFLFTLAYCLFTPSHAGGAEALRKRRKVLKSAWRCYGDSIRFGRKLAVTERERRWTRHPPFRFQPVDPESLRRPEPPAKNQNGPSELEPHPSLTTQEVTSHAQP